SGTSVNIFNKIGAGTLAFTAQNTYWGETIINSGTLMIGDGGTTGGVSSNTPAITVEPGATLAVNRSDTVTQGTNPFKVAVSGEGGFTQAGNGTTVLMFANTYIGPTTLEAGTLTLGAAGVLPDASDVFIGNATLTTGSFAETAGRLDITSTATLQLGSGATLAFADSSAVDWTGGTLTITGSFVSGSSLRFGTTSSGLTPAQLAQITRAGVTNFLLDTNGYLIANTASTFTSWQTANSSAGAFTADHDGDGVANGIEYFLGGSGNTTGTTPLPGVTSTSGTLTITWTKSATYPGVYGINFWIESTDTLTGTWTTETVGGNVAVNGSNIIYTFPASTRRFVRLKVVGP
ncbi:MAG: autotransporter-associated beta strand repeat-containing protein, partial [Verrucomicrobiaceae bacterium]|nr:autotransporter-associated beta strand repeat-containing protein [Verrucomicrobiaceae bacterium]